MDKSLIVKVLVVFFALLFLLEPFAMTVQNWSQPAGPAGETFSATANVNVTIYSYGAFLYVNVPSDSQLEQISQNPEVLNSEELESGFYRITLRDSSKTAEVHTGFKNLGIGSVAAAQVGLPDEYEAELLNGSKITIFGGYQQLFMEPMVEQGRTISYVIAVETDGATTYRILDAKPYYRDAELTAQVEIVDAGTSAYVFSIPWENRTVDVDALSEEYGAGNVSYERRDYVTFDPPLDASETLFLKQDYVTYISQGSASILANFTDRETAEADFMGKASFPDSTLQVMATEAPSLPFGYEQVKTYTVVLPGSIEGYVLEAQEISLPSELDFAEGQEATVMLSATVTGDMVIGVKDIVLTE